MKRFIVASASPRRRELLSAMGFDFQVIPSDADEAVEGEISPRELVKLLAEKKAKSVFEKNRDAVVLGCDTVVEYEGVILGKPEHREQAREMLRLLSGKKHSVHTGVCILDGEKTKSLVTTVRVEFYDLSQELIEAYTATGDCDDKAGSYGIQGIGSVLVRGIEGDYFSVVGLPVAETVRVLAEFGIRGTILL